MQETVGVELARVAEVLADPSLAQMLAVPNLPLKTRRDIAEQLGAALSLQPLMNNFLRVLAENGRLNIITHIESAYQHLLERALGRVRAKVRSAAPLSEEELNTLRESYAALSRREREVMALVVSGKLNKQVGGELGISEVTVKTHRGRVMRKMKAGSLPDLVNMAARLQPRSAPNA